MIDALTAADAKAASGLSAAFNWPHRQADWDVFLQVGHGFAWREGGALLGTALWFPLGPNHASIGGVQVAPAAQGRGIGRQLMQAVLDDAAPRALTLQATAEGVKLYEGFGFRPAGLTHQWHGECRVNPVANGVRRAETTDRTAISALDAAIRVARDDVLDVWRDGAVTAISSAGYGVRRRFGRGELIGPLVAYDEPAALSLAQYLAHPGFLRIDIPADAPLLANWAKQAGLTHVADAFPMQHGAWPVPARGRVWALPTQALG